MPKDMKFATLSLKDLDMNEKIIERMRGITGTGIKNKNANPARCQGPQRPKMLNNRVSMPNNHKIPDMAYSMTVKILAVIFIIVLLCKVEYLYHIYCSTNVWQMQYNS